MSRSCLLGVVASVAFVAFLVGCGGTVESSKTSDPTPADPAGSPSTMSTTAPTTAPSCTSAIPVAGDACSGTFTGDCEYGAAVDLRCNTVASCVTRRSSCNSEADCAASLQDRIWSITAPDPTACTLPPDTSPLPPQPSACPTQRPHLGTSCPVDLGCGYSCAEPELVCVDGFWAEGAVSACPGTGTAAGGSSGP